MSRVVGETFEAPPCVTCGDTRRYRSSRGCQNCARTRNAARVWSGPLTMSLRHVVGRYDEHPFDRDGRRRCDESAGIATHYRGPFFDRCELCGRPGLVDGIVCENCAPLVNAPAPEAHFREPDFSDVARRLAEMRR